MKKFFTCLCLAVLMLFSSQAFSQNDASEYSKFVPARATLVGDGFEFTKDCQVYFVIDAAYNKIDFQVRNDGDVSEMIHFNVDYMLSNSDIEYVLYLDKNSICVISEARYGHACKLIINQPTEDFEKMIFLFYLLE